MSNTATVTLTLKSKPKIQLPSPRSPAAAVKLKLTKPGGSPPTAPSSAANVPTAPQPPQSNGSTSPERKPSPPKLTASPPKLLRKSSIPSVATKAALFQKKEEPVRPLRTSSRFSLKRNSIDKTESKNSEKKDKSPEKTVSANGDKVDAVKVEKTLPNGDVSLVNGITPHAESGETAKSNGGPQDVVCNGSVTVEEVVNSVTDQKTVDTKEEKPKEKRPLVRKSVKRKSILGVELNGSCRPAETAAVKSKVTEIKESVVEDAQQPSTSTSSTATTIPNPPQKPIVNAFDGLPPLAAALKSREGESEDSLVDEDASSTSTLTPVPSEKPDLPIEEQITVDNEITLFKVDTVKTKEKSTDVNSSITKLVVVSTNPQVRQGESVRNVQKDSNGTSKEPERVKTMNGVVEINERRSSQQEAILSIGRPSVGATGTTGVAPQAGSVTNKDVKPSSKPPKVEVEKKDEGMLKSIKASAFGKTLQKPLNLAQKILEATLQKSPSSSSSVAASSHQTVLVHACLSTQPASPSLVEKTQHCFSPTSSLPPSRPTSVMGNMQTVDIRNLGRLLRSPTPRPLSCLDVDKDDCERSDSVQPGTYPGNDTASSSGVSCSFSTNSLATTVAQLSRSVSPESLISQSAASSRHNSKKVDNLNKQLDRVQVEVEKRTVEAQALERKQARLESELKAAHYSLRCERAELEQLHDEVRDVKVEKNEVQQRLDEAIAESVRKEKLVQKLQRELHEQTGNEDQTEIQLGALRHQQSLLEEQCSSQQEDMQDLMSQIQMLKEKNKQMEVEVKKQKAQFSSELAAKDNEMEQIKLAANKEVAHYQKILDETQQQRRELLRKTTELQENKLELLEQVHQAGDAEATEKRLKKCLYRTLVLLRDARVTIEHMRATQPSRTHLSKLRQKAEEADQLKEIAERAKEAAVAQTEQLEQALEQLVQTKTFLQTKCDKMSNDNKILQRQVDEMGSEHQDVVDKYRKQVSVVSNDQEYMEEQANKIVKLEAQVETLESRLQQLKFERQVDEDCKVNTVLNSFESRTTQLETKLEMERMDKQKLQTQCNRMSDQVEQLQRQLESSQKRESSLQLTCTNQQRSLLDMRRELADARDRCCQMRMERQTMDSQLEELIEEVRHLQTCLRVANQRIRDLEIALETQDPIQIESIMESIIEDSASSDYEDAESQDQ